LTTLIGAARHKTAAAEEEKARQNMAAEIPPCMQSKYHTFGQRMKLNIYLHT
jgi:hypothetical protein